MQIFGQRRVTAPDAGVGGGQKLPEFLQLAWRSRSVKQVAKTRSAGSQSAVCPGVSSAQRGADGAAKTHPAPGAGTALLGTALPGLHPARPHAAGTQQSIPASAHRLHRFPAPAWAVAPPVPAPSQAKSPWPRVQLQ